MLNPELQFLEAIQAEGLTPPPALVADGRLKRFASNGKSGDQAGWYIFHGDGIPAGSFGDWRSGLNRTWRADIGREWTPAEQERHRERAAAMQRERAAEEERRHAKARTRAADLWSKSSPCLSHPYLARKRIQPHGARQHAGKLLIPLRHKGELRSLQFIGADGSKQFLSGGQVAGGCFLMGRPEGAEALCIAEGFATGASLREATGLPVVVAFHAGNLEAVALAMRRDFPGLELILCADDDAGTAGNPGLRKAEEAARAVSGRLAVPDFGPDRPEGVSDFNDLLAHCGPEALRRAVDNARPVDLPAYQPDASRATEADSEAWPEPLPLTVKLESEPYPVDALPPAMRAAVEEVAAFVKAPLPLVAASALSALSIAIQAHVDAKRAERLQGPSGVYLLTIADSGERKSTCDGFFTQALRDYEEEQAELAKPRLNAYRAALEAWEAECDGIKEKIRQQAKSGVATEERKEALRALYEQKPNPPRIPRLLYSDTTPEALAFNLATHWPSGGVVSSEAGIVFGGHGMGKESLMRNLSLLNLLWDGNSVTIDRRSKESFSVTGARMTVALQVQEPTLREFLERSGAQARGSGFLSRFLVAWPESTQGSRPFTEAPDCWPHLAEFNRRLASILARPVRMDEAGALLPFLMTLTQEAKTAWRAYHDEVEAQLSIGGTLHDVRDVASKSADNAARLAVLFQVFENGESDAVAAECLAAACRLAAWHLNESRRFFGELALPPELSQAARLDSWLNSYCRREGVQAVPLTKLQQSGPSGIRSKAALEKAIAELSELKRVRIHSQGRKRSISMIPLLGFLCR
jgi:putative DNA primase/helicase